MHPTARVRVQQCVPSRANVHDTFNPFLAGSLHVMILREKAIKETLAKQIERTNKLARTVLMMTDDTTDSIGSSFKKMGASRSNEVESAKHGTEPINADEDNDLVWEFDFFSQLAEKVKKEGKAVTDGPEVQPEVLDMTTFRAARQDQYFKRAFRYYCNEELNLESLLFFEQASRPSVMFMFTGRIFNIDIMSARSSFFVLGRAIQQIAYALHLFKLGLPAK